MRKYDILSGNEISIIQIINPRYCFRVCLTKRSNMSKLEKIFWLCITIAEMVIVGFWVAGLNGNLKLAAVLFYIGGGLCWVALGCLGLKKLRNRHLCY